MSSSSSSIGGGGKKARRYVYRGGNKSLEESEHYKPPETQEQFQTYVIPLKSYSNRSRYFHKLMILLEQLLIGDVPKRPPCLRPLRIRLMEFWLSGSYRGEARKGSSWKEHVQVLWSCICRLTAILMDDSDYEASTIDGLSDRVPGELLPYLDPDNTPRTIIKLDMLSFWRAVRIAVDYVGNSDRARYSSSLIGYLTSLVLACSRFLTRVFPKGSPDLNVVLYRRSFGLEDAQWAVNQRFISDSEDAFHSMYKVLRMHQEILRGHEETRMRSVGGRREGTIHLEERTNIERPLQDALFRFFSHGLYKEYITRYLAKRIHEFFVGPIDGEQFSHLYPYDEPNPFNVLSKYRPHVIDRLHSLLSKADEDVYTSILAEPWLNVRVLPLLLTIVLDYFVKYNSPEPFDLERAHIFIGQMDETRLGETHAAEQTHPVLLGSMNEWFVVSKGRMLARGDSFLSALAYWIRISQLGLPLLTSLASLPTERARDADSSQSIPRAPLARTTDIDELPSFY